MFASTRICWPGFVVGGVKAIHTPAHTHTKGNCQERPIEQTKKKHRNYLPSLCHQCTIVQSVAAPSSPSTLRRRRRKLCDDVPISIHLMRSRGCVASAQTHAPMRNADSSSQREYMFATQRPRNKCTQMRTARDCRRRVVCRCT